MRILILPQPAEKGSTWRSNVHPPQNGRTTDKMTQLNVNESTFMNTFLSRHYSCRTKSNCPVCADHVLKKIESDRVSLCLLRGNSSTVELVHHTFFDYTAKWFKSVQEREKRRGPKQNRQEIKIGGKLLGIRKKKEINIMSRLISTCG